MLTFYYTASLMSHQDCDGNFLEELPYIITSSPYSERAFMFLKAPSSECFLPH